MNPMDGQVSDVYEGNEPYLFISYSHKDHPVMLSVKQVLGAQNIRYWYDNGLHSGDDWNMVIAKRLKGAAACLLLLSPNSAASEYVKNELNFAMNHRIPIHTLLISQFELPLDIEMMTGRIQMVEMEGDYRLKLLKALPPEVSSGTSEWSDEEIKEYSHPMFTVEKQLSDRQGTKIHTARHKRLDSLCNVLEETLQSDELAEMENRLRTAGRMEHPLFPKILDYGMDGHRVLVYQEYTGVRFLDEYLSSERLSPDAILAWMENVVEGIAGLYKKNLALRDFARGSMIVTDAETLKIIRVYHPYYGYIRFQEETRRYYFDKELQEIAILLAQLCLGREPLLPIRMIEDDRFSKPFLQKVNLIIQKCAKENGSAQYRSFEEVIADLRKVKINGKEKVFLKNRAKKLLEYDKARSHRSDHFVSDDLPPAADSGMQNPEKQFGFEETVFLQEASVESKPAIRILICSNGQILQFTKKEILIGRDTRCDMIWTQPQISRMHLGIRKNEDQTYTVLDLNSTHGTFISDNGQGDADWKQVPCGGECLAGQGTRIRIGSSEIQIL